MLRYSMALADRFSTIHELLSANDHEWKHLGITNQTDRSRLIEQARLCHDRVNRERNIRTYYYSNHVIISRLNNR
jgi:hypothetical protein